MRDEDDPYLAAVDSFSKKYSYFDRQLGSHHLQWSGFLYFILHRSDLIRFGLKEFYRILTENQDEYFTTTAIMLMGELVFSDAEFRQYLEVKLDSTDESTVLACLGALLKVKRFHDEELVSKLSYLLETHRLESVRFYASIVICECVDISKHEKLRELINGIDPSCVIDNEVLNNSKDFLKELFKRHEDHPALFQAAKNTLKSAERLVARYSEFLEESGQDWRIQYQEFWTKKPFDNELTKELFHMNKRLYLAANELPFCRNQLRLYCSMCELIWKLSLELQEYSILEKITFEISNCEFVQRPEFYLYNSGRAAYHEMNNKELAQRFFQSAWDCFGSDNIFGLTQWDEKYLSLISKPAKKY